MSNILIEIEADDLVALDAILRVPDGQSIIGNDSSSRIFKARRILGLSTEWPHYCLPIDKPMDWSNVTRVKSKDCDEKEHRNDFYGSRFTFDVRSSAENMAIELDKHCQRKDFNGWEILCLFPREEFDHVNGGRHQAVNVIWQRKAE